MIFLLSSISNDHINMELSMKKSISLFLVLMLSLSLLHWGCSSSDTVKGGAIGAAAGGILGGIIGKQAGNTAVGAIIGAAVGGTAGALIGHYMDKQAEEMRQDIKDAKIERVGEGIKITFNSGILFETAKSTLQAPAKANVEKLSTILNKYPDTNILIEGHTDSDGSTEYNQKLSEDRANAVSSHLKGQGVPGSRITTVGYGETQPVASNATPDGKQQNRRVEIAIFANDKLKGAATSNQLQ
jgi:outer membrane protein OmpA-like peptidoglycan-associated protein